MPGGHGWVPWLWQSGPLLALGGPVFWRLEPKPAWWEQRCVPRSPELFLHHTGLPEVASRWRCPPGARVLGCTCTALELCSDTARAHVSVSRHCL